MQTKRNNGFTIVELLIVIVIIGILAAITIAAFNGVQTRAQTSKINSDLAMLQKAIMAGRINLGDVAGRYVTNSSGTAGGCTGLATDIDLTDKTTASTCWSGYNNALNAISNASNINVRGIVDPWGRPYFLDENEQEGGTLCGIGPDMLGVYPRPRVQGSWSSTNTRYIPYITPGC